MKEIEIATRIQVYEGPEELSAQDRQLLAAAKGALETAYAPYSNFLVGAAVRLANGATATGGNQENAAYPMCLCAERAALAAATSQYPGVPITAIAVTVQYERNAVLQPGAPCGACRQVICEHEDRFRQPIAIILQGEQGEVYKLNSGRDLLPLSFNGGYLL